MRRSHEIHKIKKNIVRTCQKSIFPHKYLYNRVCESPDMLLSVWGAVSSHPDETEAELGWFHICAAEHQHLLRWVCSNPIKLSLDDAVVIILHFKWPIYVPRHSYLWLLELHTGVIQENVVIWNWTATHCWSFVKKNVLFETIFGFYNFSMKLITSSDHLKAALHFQATAKQHYIYKEFKHTGHWNIIFSLSFYFLERAEVHQKHTDSVLKK